MLNLSEQINVASNNVDAKYSPKDSNGWDSVDQFLNWVDTNLIQLKKNQTILVKFNGIATEMWNPINERTFVIKNESSNNVPSSSSLEFIIDPVYWNITVGDIEKNSEGRYSEQQYDQMHNNAKGINNAIKYAYDNGYNKVILKRNIYCFCPSDSWVQVILLDLNNFTFDLNGSTCKFKVDSTARSKYETKNYTQIYDHSGCLINISYCNDVKICNGILIGDRFERVYNPDTNEGSQEQTYGLQIGCGCSNITVENIEAREFMGDGINGGGTRYYTSNNIDEVPSYSITTNFLPAPPAKRSQYINEKGQFTGELCNWTITDFIDVNRLYSNNLHINNRLKNKNDRVFSLSNTRGISKLCSCYPYNIGIITYSSLDGQPLRKIEISYTSKFKLSPNERYVKLLFFGDDYVFDEFDPDKTYSYGDKIVHFEDNVIMEFECVFNGSALDKGSLDEGYSYDNSNWIPIGIKDLNSSITYDPNYEKYTYGSRVTLNIGTAGVCYSCKKSGKYDSFIDSNWQRQLTAMPCTSSVTHNVGIEECVTYGVKITNCKLINNHRGSISNMPHETIIEDCTFSKYYKVSANDGFPAPNPGGKLIENIAGWSTNYYVDIEDYYCGSIQFIRCHFEPTSENCSKLLLGCLKATFKQCTGMGIFSIFPNSYINISDNDFERFSFGVTPLHLNKMSTGNRYNSRDIIINNNKLHSGSFIHTLYTDEGHRFKFTNNFIYEDFISGDITGGKRRNSSSDFIFANNTIRSKKGKLFPANPQGLSARKLLNNDIEIKSKFELCSPIYCDISNRMKIDTLNLSESYECQNRYFNGLNLDFIGRLNLNYKNNLNSNQSTENIYFNDCEFNFTDNGNLGFVFQGDKTDKRTTPMTINVYFTRCNFYSIIYKGNIFIDSGITGDTFNLIFKDCDINTRFEEMLHSDSSNKESVNIKFINCLTNSNKKCNNVNIINQNVQDYL